MASFAVNDQGYTGRYSGARAQFKWELNFTLGIVKEVYDSKGACGLLAEVKHAMTKDKRNVYLSTDSLSSVDKMTNALNVAFQDTRRAAIFLIRMGPNSLKDYVNEKLQEYWINSTEEELQSQQLMLVGKVGRQDSGDFVLGPHMAIDSDGKQLKMEETYVWALTNERPKIYQPLRSHYLKELFACLRHSLSPHHFLKCLQISGSALKGMFYEDIASAVQHVGVTAVFGRCNTGKSLCTEVALSLFGQQHVANLHKASVAKAMQKMNGCTLPWCINDVLNIGDISQIVQMAFEDGQVENMRASYRCHSPPIITCNTDVITEASSNTRISSRLTLIPMVSEVELSVKDQQTIKAGQLTASGSISDIVRVGKAFQTEAFVAEVMKAKTRIKTLLPPTCPTRDRLGHTYAVDMVTTFVLTDLLNMGDLNEELWKMFECDTIPAISSFQSIDSYDEQKHSVGINEFVMQLLDHEQADQMMALTEDCLFIRLNMAFQLTSASPETKRLLKAGIRQLGLNVKAGGKKRFPGADGPKSAHIFVMGCFDKSTISAIRDTLTMEVQAKETMTGEGEDEEKDAANGTMTGEGEDEEKDAANETMTGEGEDEEKDAANGTMTGEVKDEEKEAANETMTGEGEDEEKDAANETMTGEGEDEEKDAANGITNSTELHCTTPTSSGLQGTKGRKLLMELSVNVGIPKIDTTIAKNYTQTTQMDKRITRKRRNPSHLDDFQLGKKK